MATATMDEVFRMFRNFGMSEKQAGEAARVVPHRDEVVTKTERETERETERAAARAVREAERAADREAFAAKDDVTVLQGKVENTDSAIERIDKTLLRIDERFERIDERFERIDATIVEIKETAARTDERINSLQAQNRLIFSVLLGLFLPLHLVAITALIGLLTRGILWGVAP